MKNKTTTTNNKTRYALIAICTILFVTVFYLDRGSVTSHSQPKTPPTYNEARTTPTDATQHTSSQTTEPSLDEETTKIKESAAVFMQLAIGAMLLFTTAPIFIKIIESIIRNSRR